MHDDDAVAERHDEIHVVLDDDHDPVGRTQRGEFCRQLRRLVVVQSGGGLVEQQDARIGDQGAGDLQHALSAIGQAPGIDVGVALKVKKP